MKQEDIIRRVDRAIATIFVFVEKRVPRDVRIRYARVARNIPGRWYLVGLGLGASAVIAEYSRPKFQQLVPDLFGLANGLWIDGSYYRAGQLCFGLISCLLTVAMFMLLGHWGVAGILYLRAPSVSKRRSLRRSWAGAILSAALSVFLMVPSMALDRVADADLRDMNSAHSTTAFVSRLSPSEARAVLSNASPGSEAIHHHDEVVRAKAILTHGSKWERRILMDRLEAKADTERRLARLAANRARASVHG